MMKITLKKLINKKDLILFFLILCGWLINDNVFAIQSWSRNFVTVNYDKTEGNVVIRFKFIDYHFGPGNENGYITYMNFSYSEGDNGCFYDLMRAVTADQDYKNTSWLIMQNKEPHAQLYFYNECYNPASGTLWPDLQDYKVEVNNATQTEGYLTIKWKMDSKFHNIKKIRINGKWRTNGPYQDDYFDLVDYDLPDMPTPTPQSNKAEASKAEVTVPNNKLVKVVKNADEIVITGAEIGETIKVYTVTGEEIKSVVSDSNVVKIQLPTQQIYIVKVGQAHFKIAL